MKRIISLLILICVFSCCLISCDRSYDENEVLCAARVLIEKSGPLNYIIWGGGIKYIEGGDEGSYREADPEDLKKYGFETVEELKKQISEVYTAGYCESIFSTVFSSWGDEDGILGLARYIQEYSDRENTVPKRIMVYSNANVFIKDEIEYLFDTLKVIGSEKEVVYVEITVKVTRDGDAQMHTKKIALLEEENGWRIDSPTYMNYIVNN